MSEPSAENVVSENDKNSTGTILFAVIFITVAVVFAYLITSDDSTEQSPAVDITETEAVIKPVVEVEVIAPPIVADIVPDIVETPVTPAIVLPKLDDSDDFVNSKIAKLSWRKELLHLVLSDDLVRRVVVFTDNFAQGEIAYSHLPLQSPQGRYLIEKQAHDITDNIAETRQSVDTFIVSAKNQARYLPYIDLIHSFEPEVLVAEFIEIEPLFAQAYRELGYGDKAFRTVLQSAIDRILDIKIPNDAGVLVQPSVAYKYQQQSIEALPAADKFLLRLGKENLLQLKAVALELNNQLHKDRD